MNVTDVTNVADVPGPKKELLRMIMSSLFGICRDQGLIRFIHIYPHFNSGTLPNNIINITSLPLSWDFWKHSVIPWVHQRSSYVQKKMMLSTVNSTTWTAEQLSLKGCRAPMFPHETTATVSGIDRGCGHVLILCKFEMSVMPFTPGRNL